MNHIRKISICLAVLMSLFMVFGAAADVMASNTLAVGSDSGSIGYTATLPITISLDSEVKVGSLAFTLGYDPGVFEFVGLEQETKAISDASEYYTTTTGGAGTYTGYTADVVENTMFYQVNDLGDLDGNKFGRVLVAAASAHEVTGPRLFKAKFLIKGGDGTYPIELLETIVHNPAAGYNTPTITPVLVGMPAAYSNAEGYYPTPVYTASLVDGHITVSATKYTITGSVTYGDGGAANGSIVELQKPTAAAGGYWYIEQTTVRNGTYSFSKPAGSYRLVVHPYDPMYLEASSDWFELTQNVTRDFTLASGAVRKSGTVTINGQVLPGVRVKVFDENGKLIRIYPVNDQGYFETEALAPGDYTYVLVYGNQESGSISEANIDGYNWPLTLYSIAGTVKGLSSDDEVVIEAASQTGKLLKFKRLTAGSAVDYTIVNLVPANDYIVSATTANNPVQYYSNVTDITQATKVDISSANATSIDFDFTSVETATITGQVVKNGSGVADIGVYALEVNTYGLVSQLTDSAGNYTLTVAPGSYEVFVFSSGKAFYYKSATETTQKESEATILVLNAGDSSSDANIDITECDCTLSGNVTYERTGGDPVAGALITAISDKVQAAGFTRRDGSYLLTGLCQDTYQVEMNPLTGDYAIQVTSITIDGSNCDSVAVNFIIDTGNTLSGQVTEQGTVTPISRAMLYLTDNSTGELVGHRMYFTNPQGNYSIGDIPTGVYTLHVSHPRFESATVEDLDISADTTQDVELSKGAFIYGHVEDGSFNAIAGATIIAVVADEEPSYAVTDGSGDYAIYGLDSTKTYLVFASKRGYERAFHPNLVQPATPDGTMVDFTLTPPAETFDLDGTVTTDCTSYTQVVGATVIASYNPGAGKPDSFKVTTTVANGYYSFTGLPQDANYHLVVVPPGNLRLKVISNIDGTGGDVTQNIFIPCGGAISGKITLGTAANLVYVVLWDSSSGDLVGYVAVITPDAAGKYPYSFDGLAAGNYKVVAGAAGNVTKWYATDPDTGADRDQATAVSSPASDIDITLSSSQ